jgi:hypothetical protein
MPRGVRRAQRDIEKAIGRLEHRLGRPPTEPEVAKEMQMSLADDQDLLADARGAHGALLLGGLVASAALRAGLPLAEGRGQVFAALLAAEAFSFFGVLGDATVLSNLPKDQVGD